MDPTRRPVTAGFALVTLVAVVTSATVWLFPVPNDNRVSACAVAAAMIVVALAAAALVQRTPRPGVLVVFPLIVFAGLSWIGWINWELSSPYTGFFVMSFIYVGLCLPRGATIRLIIPATATWLISNGVLSGAPLTPLDVRLPITVFIWICIGVLLSHQTTTTTRSTASLRDQAHHDPLTALLNRRGLDQIVSAALAGDTLVLLDLDHFKTVNDRYGHAVGDGVLVEFAGVLSASVRDGDLVVRYGGEEFLLYLPGTTPAQADLVLRRIHDQWHATEPLTTFSAGVATIGPDGDTGRALVEADASLYAAKSEGRDQWVQSSSAPTP
jgi:diguanylate cyclase (GGDEF)-like protein